MCATRINDAAPDVQETETKNKPKTSPFWIARNFDISKRKPNQWSIKRFVDCTASLLGLLVISPALLAVSILIRSESPGPIIYKSKRTGLHGKEFYAYKFRSMRQDAEQLENQIRAQFNEQNNIMYKMEDDPRVTKIGKFIRKFSIDELPQLVNVIKGEMSLVGPRPRPTVDLKLYEKWHYVFFGAVPGLTGMWQTSGRSSVKDFDTIVKMEYDYITNWSLLLDIYLLLKTIPVVILGKNTA